MPRIFQKRSGTWVEIKSIFQKQGGTWAEILNVFQKIGGTWTRVFSGLKIPGNTVAPTITGTGYLFSTLTNNSLGTWTNSPTSYTRQWRRGTPSVGGGEPTSYSNISGATSNTYTTVEADDGKYIICQVTATNAVGSNSAASNSIYINKYAPVSLAKYIISGNPAVGATLTTSEVIGSTWKSTTDVSGDTYPDTFFYEWKWADTGAPAYNDNNSTIYPVTEEDLGHTIAVRVTATNTGGSTTSEWSNATAAVTQQYTFSFGKSLFVGSNGYIGLDAGGSSASSMGSGRNLSIFVKDLQQWYLAEYSTSTFYTLYFRSYIYNTIGSPAARNALDYQIKFYNDPSIKYCDVYIVRKGDDVTSATLAPGYYSNGNSGYTGIQGPYFLGTGSTMRIYFDGTVATTGISWTTISDLVWDLIRDDRPTGLDDSFTEVVTAANQSAPIPVNTSIPTLTTSTGDFSAGSTITLNVGSWTGTSSYAYEILYSSSTPIASDSTSTKTLINTNQYVITNADATASSYYFRGRVTGYSGSGQTGNSTIALSNTSARSNINPTTTISVGTATSSGFTISGTAGPLNGFGGTYVNVSQIQIYNSSQTLLSTITTGLPAVDGTTGNWSYAWTGGSASTTYYAKVTVKATDSAETTFTTAFSSSIATIAGTVTPTSLTATTNDSGKITLTWSGGSADTYLLYWLTGGTSSWPAQTFTGSDFTDTASPYEWGNGTPTNPVRGVTYYFFVRARSGTSPNFTYGANWYPAQATGIIGKAPLYAPPTPNTPTSSGVTTTNITVSWTAGTNGTTNDTATSYEIFTNTTGTAPSTGTSGTTATSPVSYTYTASTSPSTQYFWVRGVTEGGNSAWSGRLSATPTALNPPGVVSSVASTSKTSSSITWGWSAPTTGGTPNGYEYAISTSTTEPTTFTNLGSTTRSVTTSSLSANTDYYLFVKAKNADGTSAAVRNVTAVKTDSAVTLYKVTFSNNGASGAPSVTSVTQTTSGGAVTLATKNTLSSGTNIFGGWRTGPSSGTVYAFGASYTPTQDITLYAYYGAVPTCAAPAWTLANNFRRVNSESQIIWFTDYPTPSGAYTGILDMQFQISTTESTTGLLIGSTRAYPGSGQYPYAGAGSVWGFKCGKDRSSVTTNRVDDVAFSTSSRYARARVRMTGIDGQTYTGTYSGWI